VYVIDPTTTHYPIASGDDGPCQGTSSTYPPASAIEGWFTTGEPDIKGKNLYFPPTYLFGSSVGLTRFDTSGLPDDATVTSAKRVFVLHSQGGLGQPLADRWLLLRLAHRR
jgi:hypothetical protein